MGIYKIKVRLIIHVFNLAWSNSKLSRFMDTMHIIKLDDFLIKLILWEFI